MKNELWKLVATYELLLELGPIHRPVRIEVFKSNNGSSRFRARLWVQGTYNLYPTFLNMGPQGQDLHKIHSSEEMNQEITSLVVENPAFIEGIEFQSEVAFVEALQGLVTKYQKTINAN